MTGKTCSQCGVEQDPSARFCRNCGAPLSEPDSEVIRCRWCGCELENEAYCPDCGKATGITVCPNCRQKSVNEDYCSVCGYKINKNIKTCTNCGSNVDAEAKVCANCGAGVANKSPVIALLLSMLFPGLGQLYNNQNRKAAILIAGYIASVILCLILIGVIPAIVIWIYGMYDAFVSAKAINNGEILEDKIF